MRFSAKNYEKAFPRSEKKSPKVEVASDPGNVIEEAEKNEKKTLDVPETPEDPETPEEGGEPDGDE